MVRSFYKHYFYPIDERGTFADRDTVNDMPLEQLIGDTLAELIRNSDCPMEFVRLNFGGGSKVTAFRRISDIKVTVEYVKQYE